MKREQWIGIILGTLALVAAIANGVVYSKGGVSLNLGICIFDALIAIACFGIVIATRTKKVI